MKVALVFGNQLHRDHPALSDDSVDAIVLIEAQNICSKLNYHKQKLVFLLSAMRHWAEYAKNKKQIIYRKLDSTPHFLEALNEIINSCGIAEIAYMRPPNISTGNYIDNFCKKHGLKSTIYPSNLFITPLNDLIEWTNNNPKSNMESFYRWQRRRTGYLMNGAKPEGGIWNFDQENRKSLPKNFTGSPPLPTLKFDNITNDVCKIVNTIFPNFPGKTMLTWLPVTHEDSDLWLDDFLIKRVENFGKFEDAIDSKEVFLYHSVLSPLLNIGLINPSICVEKVINLYTTQKISIASAEGFIRQIIGWREYMYGKYLQMTNFRELNYFGYKKELESWWYEMDSKHHSILPIPMQLSLKKAFIYGYNHHIERLMVLGNWFLLNNYAPMSVYKWFSSMYVDAYEWVMVPNVIGMSQFADGGSIATKPYISGGNYLKKMGKWEEIHKDDLDIFTKLYWDFLKNNYEKLKNNHRMQIVLKRINK